MQVAVPISLPSAQEVLQEALLTAGLGPVRIRTSPTHVEVVWCAGGRIHRERIPVCRDVLLRALREVVSAPVSVLLDGQPLRFGQVALSWSPLGYIQPCYQHPEVVSFIVRRGTPVCAEWLVGDVEIRCPDAWDPSGNLSAAGHEWLRGYLERWKARRRRRARVV